MLAHDPYPSATITLIGRSSRWGFRVSALPPRPLPLRPSSPSGQAIPPELRRVEVAWLHHRSYGTLGIYRVAQRDERGDDGEYDHGHARDHGHDEVLPGRPRSRQWLQVIGSFQPWWVYAQADDPRSSIDHCLAPLALVVAAVTPVVRGEALPTAAAVVRPPEAAPCFERPQQARVCPGRRCGNGTIAPVAQFPDVSYWHSRSAHPSMVRWNQIVGVTAPLGTQRTLRYVLSSRLASFPSQHTTVEPWSAPSVRGGGIAR